MNASIITQTYEGNPIPFQADDAFVNATKMCKPFGQKPYEFLRLATTGAFIAALKEDKALRENPVVIINGGKSPGTWLHPDLALECARWLSPKFAIWCNRVIRQILAGDNPKVQAPTLSKLEILEMALASERKALALTEQNTHLNKMMGLISPDWSQYGALANNGQPRTGIRRAAFVAARCRLLQTAVLLSAHEQLDLALEDITR